MVLQFRSQPPLPSPNKLYSRAKPKSQSTRTKDPTLSPRRESVGHPPVNTIHQFSVTCSLTPVGKLDRPGHEEALPRIETSLNRHAVATLRECVRWELPRPGFHGKIKAIARGISTQVRLRLEVHAAQQVGEAGVGAKRTIATWRTRPWPAEGWGCRDRRPSRA